MQRPSIVWITIDSLRADHASVCGYQRETTPNLRRLAADDRSRAFEQCFSHGIWSLPSVASMFTGTVPSRHGVGLWNDALPSSMTTVSEILSKNGWRTEGVSVNSFFSPETNLDRGFDSFTKVSRSNLLSTVGIRGLLKYPTVGRNHTPGLTRDLRKFNPDFLMQEALKRRIDDLAGDDSPFFLAAHYQGAHHPYYPSLHFAQAFEDDYDLSAREAREIAFDLTTDVYESIAHGDPNTQTEQDALVWMYDSLVRQSDALVGGLLEYVRSKLGDEVVVVVTSDHGDLLGEYRLLSHKLVVHDAVSHVPLVASGSEALSEASDGIVQHADVIATLLAERGLPHESLQGHDISTSEREFAITQRGEQTCQKTLREIRERNPDFQNEYVHEPLLTALRTRGYKYLESGETTRLYDLPEETRDVSENRPEVRDELADELSSWFEKYGDPVETDEDAKFSDDARERLRQLGYVVD